MYKKCVNVMTQTTTYHNNYYYYYNTMIDILTKKAGENRREPAATFR
jgi:hypothetical protein